MIHTKSIGYNKIQEHNKCPENVIANGSNVTTSSNGQYKNLEQVLQRLEKGCVLVKLVPKSRPERRFFCVDRSCKQLYWNKSVTLSSPLDGIIDLRTVREVRFGPCKTLLERYDDPKRWQDNYCIIILYGNTFRLKILIAICK